MRTTAALGVLALIAGLGGCGQYECADCGPCGMMGGPNQRDGVAWNAPGLDDAGRVVVPLQIRRTGECGGNNGTSYLLVWDGATASLEPQEQDPVVDSSATTYDGDRTYAIPGQGVSIAIERDQVRLGNVLVSFTLDSTAVSTMLTCQLDAEVGGNLSCEE